MPVDVLPANSSVLHGKRYINLTTFRKSGEPVATPVWFVDLAGTLYVYTDATAGKVKRIRNNSRVEIAACTLRGAITGPTLAGEARIVADQDEIATANAAIYAKYWFTRRLLGVANKITGLFQRNRPSDGIVYLAITVRG
jgi:PPOX class probable F420-dependent enzyme